MTIAIRKAIAKENEAYEYYSLLLKKCSAINLQKFFNTMALEELKHAAMLREVLQGGNPREARKKIYGRQEEFSIKDKLNPTIDTGGLRDAIEKAIKREIESVKLYRKLLTNSKTADEEYLFEFLVEEEKHHVLMLKKELENF